MVEIPEVGSFRIEGVKSIVMGTNYEINVCYDDGSIIHDLASI